MSLPDQERELLHFYERQTAILLFKSNWTRDKDDDEEGEAAPYPFWDWLQAVARRSTRLGYWEWAYDRYEDDLDSGRYWDKQGVEVEDGEAEA